MRALPACGRGERPLPRATRERKPAESRLFCRHQWTAGGERQLASRRDRGGGPGDGQRSPLAGPAGEISRSRGRSDTRVVDLISVDASFRYLCVRVCVHACISLQVGARILIINRIRSGENSNEKIDIIIGMCRI